MHDAVRYPIPEPRETRSPAAPMCCLCGKPATWAVRSDHSDQFCDDHVPEHVPVASTKHQLQLGPKFCRACGAPAGPYGVCGQHSDYVAQ